MQTPIAFVLGVSLATVPCLGQPWSFTRVVDNSTPIPGGTGPFWDFEAPSIADGKILFIGIAGLGGQQMGVYHADGPALSRIADRSSIVPNTTATFQNFSSVTFDGSNPTFAGSGGGIQGLFAGPPLNPLVMSTTPHPVTGAPIGGVGPASRHGSQMAFLAGSFGIGTGVFSWSTSGQIARIADQSTQIPGGSGTFHSFVGATMSGTRAAFVGAHNEFRVGGVYDAPIGSGPLRVIADQSISIPGATGTFSSFAFGVPVTSGDSTAFVGNRVGTAFSGVYADFGNGLTRLADTTTAAPSGGLFTNFGTVSIDGNRVAFLASTQTGGEAIYFYESGVIRRVVGQNDFLPSGGVLALSFSPEGLDGNTLAFRYNLAQNPNMGAIYTATIPAPAVLSLLALGALFLHRTRPAKPAIPDFPGTIASAART